MTNILNDFDVAKFLAAAGVLKEQLKDSEHRSRDRILALLEEVSILVADASASDGKGWG